MAMHDQTPVQIAWATRAVDGMEHTLTSMLGAKKRAVSFVDYVKQEQA